MITLSDDEQIAFINLCATAPAVEMADEFQEWMRTHIKAFFPFGMMKAVIGSIRDGVILVEHFIGVDCPDEFILHLRWKTSLSDRHVVEKWYREREPQIINESHASRVLPIYELEEAKKFGLQNMATHGLLDMQGHRGSYFCFARIPGALSERHRQKLKIMAPQLHQVICKLKAGSTSPLPTKTSCALSSREREILHLIAQGNANRKLHCF